MEVIKDFENKLLERKEVIVNIVGDGTTPTRKNIKAELAKKFKAKEDLIIINKINTSYGSRDVSVDASIYTKKEIMSRLTPEHILKRNTFAAEVVEEKTEA